ncbi:glucose dehydrogenase [Thalassospira profundimaris]|uniref:glucose dehydrogenase n=1 Tax=Thalassospira profundimaris TaxID=502049 RepID=UPI0011BD53ED|nr:glucose dehydrogenase [Thalassospira profundimaris]
MDTSNEDQAAPGRGIGYWAVIALAIVILCIGMPIFAGGVWLIMLGASSFYALAGAGLFLTGFFMMRMSMLGFWFYLLTFMGTAAWTVSDVGMDMDALFQRLAVPFIALLLVFLASPRLWRGGRAARHNPARQPASKGAVPSMAFSSPDKNV